MATRTITALYESPQEAQRVRQELATAGVTRVDVHEQSTSQGGSTSSGGGGLVSGLKQMFGGHQDSHAYEEGLRRGHTLLTAQVDDDRADDVFQILERSNAVDIDAAQESWRGSGWTGGATTAQTGGVSTGLEQGREEVIPIVQEELRVGKREVERGGLRARSYVVETPVHEQVTLRQEHVDVERRAVDRPVTDAESLLQERSFEMTERSEEAVVAKDAVIREEVVIRKDSEQRTETIEDTVRHTEVDIDDGRTRPQPRT
jgi:uncharacterized protein (TIGR02271 family)